VGNINTVQLALLACALWAARPSALRGRAPFAASVLALLALLLDVLLEPALGLALAALLLYLLARRGARCSAATAALAAGLCVPLAALPRLYFGAPGLWRDWLSYLLLRSPESVAAVASRTGNTSMVQLLAEHTPWGGSLLIPCTGALLAASALAALGRHPSPGPVHQRARAGLRGLLQDTDTALHAAIAATFGLLPLVWYHYHVALVAPALWLAGGLRQDRTGALLGALALLLSSGLLLPVLSALGAGYQAAVALYAVAWVPLWIGALRRMAGAGAPARAPTAAGR